MLSLIGTQKLETNRLLLRRFKKADAQEMFANWANDPDVTKFLTWKPHGEVNVTRKVIARWVESYSEPDFFHWAIVLKEEHKLIGNISVISLCENDRSCEIGYCMSKMYWGRGVMTEALRSVIAFLFTQVGMNRIQARHDTKNPASGRVMQKAGMLYEGTLREAKMRPDGTFYDLSYWAVLKREYEPLPPEKTGGAK